MEFSCPLSLSAQLLLLPSISVAGSKLQLTPIKQHVNTVATHKARKCNYTSGRRRDCLISQMAKAGGMLRKAAAPCIGAEASVPSGVSQVGPSELA